MTGVEPAVAKRDSAMDQAVDYLHALIDLRRVLPGDILPSAAALAETIGVNRSAVLEAFHFLQREGLIRVRPGAGAIVMTLEERTSEQRLARAVAKREQLEDAVVVREILDAGIARRLASNGMPGDLMDRARAIVEELETTTDRDRFLALDTEFHEVLAEATGSPVPKNLTNELRQLIVIGLDAAELPPHYLAESNKQHRKILTAIEKGQPSAAADWAHRHAGAATRLIDAALANPSMNGRRTPDRNANNRRKR